MDAHQVKSSALKSSGYACGIPAVRGIFCAGSLSNLTWYISGNMLKTFPVGQFLINRCGPREVCKNFTNFFPRKNFAFVCKEEYVVYSNY